MKSLWIVFAAGLIGTSALTANMDRVGQTAPVTGIIPPAPDFTPVRPDPAIAELRATVAELQRAVADSRAVLMRSLYDATDAERQAALENWYTENAALLASLRVHQQELGDLLRDGVGRPLPIDVPDEIKAKQELLAESRELLHAARTDLLSSLGEDATDEEIRAALADWRAANQDAIDNVQALAAEIRDWFRAQRPEPAMRPDRPVDPQLQERRAAFRENAQAIRENRRALADQMSDPDLTAEERQAIIEAFRAEQREIMQERVDMRRQAREARTGEGGDRRPGN